MKEFSYQYIGGVEERGTIVKRDIMLTMDDKTYILSVATEGFINSLRDYNIPFEENLQIEDNILPMNSVSDLEKVVEEIRQMSWETIEPYLVQQEK